jgi:hypothetical protein
MAAGTRRDFEGLCASTGTLEDGTMCRTVTPLPGPVGIHAHGESNRISGSVGRGGVNQSDDVRLVQNLINNHLPTPLHPLKLDGLCGVNTINAIEEIQRRYLHRNPPDGRVDPNGATFRFLISRGSAAGSHTAHHIFPAEVIAAAQASHKAWKVPASVTLAQWALESNWGKAMPPGSNNPFGIKAKAGDPYVESRTHEVVKGKRIKILAKFRKFASLNDAFNEHGRLLATRQAYAHARTVIGTPDAFADALTGVYATDPDYGSELKKVMKDYNLYQYD